LVARTDHVIRTFNATIDTNSLPERFFTVPKKDGTLLSSVARSSDGQLQYIEAAEQFMEIFTDGSAGGPPIAGRQTSGWGFCAVFWQKVNLDDGSSKWVDHVITQSWGKSLL
jgi:hypothetical protein